MNRILSVALFGAAIGVLGGCPIYSDGPSTNRVCSEYGCYDCPSDSNNCGPVSAVAVCEPISTGPYGTIVQHRRHVRERRNGLFVRRRLLLPDTSTDAPRLSNARRGTPAGPTGSATRVTARRRDASPGTSVSSPAALLQCMTPTGTPIRRRSRSRRDRASSTPGTPAAPSPVASRTPPAPAPPGALCSSTATASPRRTSASTRRSAPPATSAFRGVRTPTCSVSTARRLIELPDRHACASVDDASTGGVCTGNPDPCEANPASCPTGTVCSQNHCVSTCGAGGVCPAGEECLQGGCVPNQVPVFFCGADGVQDACASGSICLHHQCYIACNPEAGAAAQRLQERRPVQPVQAGDDLERHVRRLRLEHEPRHAVRSDGRQGVRERRRLHRRVLLPKRASWQEDVLRRQ